MENDNSAVQAVVMDVHLPPGVAGPEPLDFDVRCFLVPHPDGVVLIDTGMPGSRDLIGKALARIDASWWDISDIVLTHSHMDHIGGLADVWEKTHSPVVWAGVEDHAQIPHETGLRALAEGRPVRGLVALATPGHTPGHRSLFHPELSALFLGDVAGSDGFVIRRSPAAFTHDREQAQESLGRVAALHAKRVFSPTVPKWPTPLTH
jgi:glyoxylase-like metal-dependent hydrolase (beta-lactamase superfamily II)